jgi:acyl dehydratase
VAVDDVEGKIAPPTFAAVYALGAGSGSLAQAGIPPYRLIHGEQEFTWSRPVRVGETLTAEGKIVDVTQKRNLTIVTAETRCKDETGEEVCVSRATIVVLPESGR